MSSDDDDGKTVIRPNPGGAFGAGGPRPAPMPNAIPTPNTTPVPASTPERTVISPMPSAGAKIAPGGVESARPVGDEDWMHAGRQVDSFFPQKQQVQAVTEAEKIPLDVALQARGDAEYSASNPIVAAAAPMLILLGRLHSMIIEMRAVPLMEHMAEEIRRFEQKLIAASVPEMDVQVAKYALCGTADDIVQNLPGTDRHVWLQYSMLATFFQVRTSGVGFFEELDKVLANPAPRYQLLELMHNCLSLGFEGKFRAEGAGGDTQLQAIRRRVYETLRSLQTRPDDDISPRWRGVEMVSNTVTSRVPIWVIGSILAAILVGIYILFRILLADSGEGLASRIVDLHPDRQITLERAAFTPYEGGEVSDTTQLERIKAALDGDPIDVEAVGEFIVLNVNNVVLFASGRADVKKEFEPVAKQIAAALDPELGNIKVIGHTDNVKLSGRGRFKSNYELSVARAKSVEKMIAQHLSTNTRLTVEGHGEDEPVADNSTKAGRAQNRRVEILLPKEQTLQ